MAERDDLIWIVSTNGLQHLVYAHDDERFDRQVVLWSMPQQVSRKDWAWIQHFRSDGVRPARREEIARGAATRAERRPRPAESADDVLRGAKETAVLHLTGTRVIPYRDRAKLPPRERRMRDAVERDRERRVGLAMMAPNWGAKVERELKRVVRRLRAGGHISKSVAAELARRGYPRAHRSTVRNDDTTLELLKQLLRRWEREKPRLYARCASAAGLSSRVRPDRLARWIHVLESDPGANERALKRAEDRLRKRLPLSASRRAANQAS